MAELGRERHVLCAPRQPAVNCCHFYLTPAACRRALSHSLAANCSILTGFREFVRVLCLNCIRSCFGANKQLAVSCIILNIAPS